MHWDGIGYFDLTLMSPEIRPLWSGLRFWGVAFTVRCVPANRPHVEAKHHRRDCERTRHLVQRVGHIGFEHLIQPGHVIVTDTGGSKEVGFWGSANSLGRSRQGQ
jgi:4-hydroxy-4-methyl-2-oxoglutarate aldolase